MSAIEVDCDHHIAQVRINRPEALNAVNSEMDRDLQAAWLRINQDQAIRVVILSSAGDRAFCAGADVKDLDGRESQRIGFGGGLTGLGGPLTILEKPLIAAVQGLALGGGFELALSADVIVAADSATFAMTEAKIGVISEAGVLHRLPRQLPRRIATGLLLTGRRLDAATAFHFGLVNEVVAEDELMASAENWASEIASASPLVVQAALAAMREGEGLPLEQAIGRRYEGIEAYQMSEDKAEAVAAFAERRRPEWLGR